MGRSPNDDVELVRSGYDRVARRYADDRDQSLDEKYLERFTRLLEPPATVLDIGCGSGEPIDSFLVARNYDVLGLDISPKQIELAKRSVPQTRFEVRDMLDLKLPSTRLMASRFFTLRESATPTCSRRLPLSRIQAVPC